MRSAAVCLALAAIAAAIPPRAFGAGGIRGQIRWTTSYVEYRALHRESFPESTIAGEGITRVLPDGTIVTCVPGGNCTAYRLGDVKSTTPVLGELHLTAWPGWRGVSSRVHVQSRLGSDAIWPRSDEELLVLAAHLDFERPAYRIRLGRQEKKSGLGFYSFDGAAGLWKGGSRARVELFGGRSLARRLFQPHANESLTEAADLPPDRDAYLWGIEGQARPVRDLAATLLYQREIRDDRTGLYSERVSADAVWAPRFLTAAFSGDLDLASLAFNEILFRVSRPLVRELHVTGEYRHYEPFFELWTIWGAFSPVGYDEGRLSGSWQAREGLRFDLSGGYRRYEDPSTEAEFLPILDDGWRVRSGASLTQGSWVAETGYAWDRGFAAYQSRLDLSVGRDLGRRGYIGLFGLGSQEFNEFRIGEGMAWGAGTEGRLNWGRAAARGSIAAYRHRVENRPRTANETELRGSLGVELGFGKEPSTLAMPSVRTFAPGDSAR